MIRWRKSILHAFAVVALAAPVYADMMPVPYSDFPLPALESVHAQARLQEVDLSARYLDPMGAGFWSIGLLDEAKGYKTVFTGPAQPASVLTDRQSSMALCLYALMGLGLCKSAPRIREFSFGVIPVWYHEGRPFQIGHSFSLSPDCLCPMEASFAQPDVGASDFLPQHNAPGVVCRCHGSQGGPSALPTRGPPCIT